MRKNIIHKYAPLGVSNLASGKNPFLSLSHFFSSHFDIVFSAGVLNGFYAWFMATVMSWLLLIIILVVLRPFFHRRRLKRWVLQQRILLISKFENSSRDEVKKRRKKIEKKTVTEERRREEKKDLFLSKLRPSTKKCPANYSFFRSKRIRKKKIFFLFWNRDSLMTPYKSKRGRLWLTDRFNGTLLRLVMVGGW